MRMLQSYLLTAVRNFRRNKLHSFLNVTGLALGIAAFLLILQYVSFERSVNGFHKDLPNLYRLLNEDQKRAGYKKLFQAVFIRNSNSVGRRTAIGFALPL